MMHVRSGPAAALLIVLTVLASFSLLRPTALRAQPEHGEREIAVPFFEAETLQIADGIAVGLFSSLIEQHFLYAVTVDDGRELARVDHVGQAPFDFDGRRIVYATEEPLALHSLDVVTGVTTALWNGATGSIVRQVHSGRASSAAVIESTDGIRVVRIDRDGMVVTGSRLSRPEGTLRFLLSGDSAFVWSDGRASGWREVAGDWREVMLAASVSVVGLVESQLLGVDAAAPAQLLETTLTADPTSTVVWTPFYTAGGPLATASIRTRGRTVTLVDRQPTRRFVVLDLDRPSLPVFADVPAGVPGRGASQEAWSPGYLAWTERRNGRLNLVATRLAAASPAVLASRSPSSGDKDRPALDPTRRALAWLERQLTARFVSKAGRNARLIVSYEGPARTGWTYDAALAAIAFTASGSPETASELLAGLEQLQDADGAWSFSFDANRAVSRRDERLVGSIAWVVMAANFYEWESGDRTFAPMATRALAFLERFRINDPHSEMRGGFTMGPDSPGTFSTEHNADCFSAFYWRGRLDNSAHYALVAQDLLAFVLRQMWVEKGVDGADRYFKVGARDLTLFLDAQTWTTLSFSGHTPEIGLQSAVASAQRALTVRTGKLQGVSDIIGLDESTLARGRPKVWAEGSEGMVAALLALGEVMQAREIHLQTARYQTVGGGVPYATENDAGWKTDAAVSSTAWFILNRQNPPRNPFNPDASHWQAAGAGREPLLPRGAR